MPVKRKVAIDPLPEEFPTLEAAAEFWDEHDATDYLQDTRPVKHVDIRIEHRQYLVALEPSLAKELSGAARRRGISTESLVNLWLTERLQTANRKGPKG